MAEQEQNRSEQATPHRLEEARKRGSVAKSIELNSLFALFAAVVLGYIHGMPMVREQLALSTQVLAQAHLLSFQSSAVWAWLIEVFSRALHIVTPLFVVVVLVAILGTLVQTGPVFTVFPLKPQMDRLNPIAGFKRLFSMRLLFELGKNIVKLGLISWLLWELFEDMLPILFGMLDVQPKAYAAEGFALALKLAGKLLLVLLIIALIDILYARRSYMDKLKMSRREVKEEVKNREGDPRVRQRMRQLQRELLKRSSSIGRLPDADVLITNPTHLAVALVYKREAMAAPQVLAKGAGEMAEHMKVLARQHRIPIIENKALARKLFRQVEIEQTIPDGLFPQVARILVWAYAWRAQVAGAPASKAHGGAPPAAARPSTAKGLA